jgi:hypothetical protein
MSCATPLATYGTELRQNLSLYRKGKRAEVRDDLPDVEFVLYRMFVFIKLIPFKSNARCAVKLLMMLRNCKYDRLT